MIENVIEFEGLGYCYRPGVWVFKNYSATIPKGHVFALLGPTMGRARRRCSKSCLEP